MSKDQKGLKRTHSALEEQFDFPPVPKWRNGSSQKVIGSELVTTEASNIVGTPTSPKCMEFIIRSEDVLSFGPNSRFKVKGKFQVRRTPTGEWENCTPADGALVCVIPNWWEMMLKDFEIWHGHTKIASSDEGRFVMQYLNTFRYCFMNEEQKKILCPEPVHPGNGIPTKLDQWNHNGKEWLDYAKLLFEENKSVEFTWTPLDSQPFFQFCNYLQDHNVQKILPMPLLDRLLIRVNFIDDGKNIFQVKIPKPADPTPEFRFQLQDFKVVTERLRLNKAFQTSLLKTPKTWPYPGLTRFIQSEIIPNQSTMYKCTIQKVAMPEGLVIFCLPKDVSTGNYEYKNKPNDNVFQKHNIEKLSFAYNNEVFYMTEPNIGTFRDPIIESKCFYDMLWCPPLGLKTNHKLITPDVVHDGFEKTPYPMVYVNFTNFGSNSRIVPFLNTGNCLAMDSDLEINFTFTTERSTPDVHYFICFYYTDTNLTLDVKKKGDVHFSFPYMKKM
jgi:hypothetical protein